jgi:hypothetical protein
VSLRQLRQLRACAVVLLLVILTPTLRHALESRMTWHMFVQIPLLLACGAALATGIPGRMRAALDRWNSHGIAGLLAFALVTALLMIPRLLDLAVANAAIDAAKALALLASGALLQLSWSQAGLLVQAFFLGNVLPMTAAVGQVYQDSPLRLCNAYLLDDQVRVGQALVGITIALAIGWLGHAAILLARREAAAPAEELAVDLRQLK